ncbi:MAG: amidase family protein [Spirochaetes bacterium]|nr:amidase family protein [Spirochaetota bacterium]
MQNFNYMEATVAGIHAAILAGEITCRSLIDFYLGRIAACDKQGLRINSVITINPRAGEEADKLDAVFKQTGKLSGALHGIPVLLKDNINTFDMPTTSASLSLKNFTPAQDAFVCAKLKAAGAIILAKMNLHEFAMWGETVSSMLGQTLNPYDLTRTPGGSSGGTGAGIAANFGVIGIGTDTINSIRSPASANCLVGIRPTMGLVSDNGIFPYAPTQDTAGPICRTVEDAALTLDVIAGHDSGDAKTDWCLGQMPAGGYASFQKKDGLKGKRIGVLERFFGKGEIHAQVNRVMDDALKIFSHKGAEMVPLADDAVLQICPVKLAAGKFDTGKFDAAWIVSNVSVHLDEFKENVNAYLGALPPGAPVHSLDEVIASGKYHPGIKANIDAAMALSTSTPEYKKKLAYIAEMQPRMIKLMSDFKLDAIIFPHQQQLVCKVGESQKERNGVLASVTGFPSIALPAGFSDPTPDAPLGVPVGMEILGRPWSEPLLLEIAYGFEQAAAVRKAPLMPV